MNFLDHEGKNCINIQIQLKLQIMEAENKIKDSPKEKSKHVRELLRRLQRFYFSEGKIKEQRKELAEVKNLTNSDCAKISTLINRHLRDGKLVAILEHQSEPFFCQIHLLRNNSYIKTKPFTSSILPIKLQKESDDYTWLRLKREQQTQNLLYKITTGPEETTQGFEQETPIEQNFAILLNGEDCWKLLFEYNPDRRVAKVMI